MMMEGNLSGGYVKLRGAVNVLFLHKVGPYKL